MRYFFIVHVLTDVRSTFMVGINEHKTHLITDLTPIVVGIAPLQTDFSRMLHQTSRSDVGCVRLHVQKAGSPQRFAATRHAYRVLHLAPRW